jgi:hypothetical protein
MSQVPVFNPSINFSELSVVDGESIDVLKNEIKAILDALTLRQNLLQRDDDRLANASVHAQAFSAVGLRTVAGQWDYTGDFVTGTSYTAGQTYKTVGLSPNVLYLAVINHVSTTVAADLALEVVLPISLEAIV